MDRSLEKIDQSDLRKLLRLAMTDIDNFFERHPNYKQAYFGKEVLIALCQGAALHYIDKRNGIKDFDVWFFYPKKTPTLPYRRRGTVDFGPSKFGKHSLDNDFEGRRIDILMRSDGAFDRASAEQGIINYLSHPRTQTSELLARKAVIGLFPESTFGKILWPTQKP